MIGRPLRVLHINAGNLYGGVETILLMLARYRDLCPQMDTHFAFCFEGRLSEKLVSMNVPVYFLGPVRLRHPLTVRRARRLLEDLLRREHFDVVVCHSTWLQSIFGPPVRRVGSSLVFWLHCPTDDWNWLDLLGRRTVPDITICNSEFTAKSLSNLYPTVCSEVVYCPVGKEGDYSVRERAATRAGLQTSQDATVIIQVSRMEAWKGHAFHLEALSLLRDLPDWVCWQVGGGQRPREVRYLEELKKMATRFRIADRVLFLGQRSDVSRLLSAADIHCQPNMGAEPFGIAFVEALYAGLPVVTTALGGACEIITEACGILTPPGDVVALSEALKILIQEEPLRARLGAAGPGRAGQICNPSTQLKLLSTALQNIN